MKKKCLKTQDIKELEKLNNSYLLNPQIDNGEFYKWLINTKDENYYENQGITPGYSYAYPYFDKPYKFLAGQVIDTMKFTDSKEKIELFAKLVDTKDANGNKLFKNVGSRWDAIRIFEALNSKERFEMLDLLLNLKNKDGSMRFQGSAMYDILINTDTEEKRQAFNYMQKAKDDNQKSRFNSEIIPKMLQGMYTDEKTESFFKLANEKNYYGEIAFTQKEILRLMKSIDTDLKKDALFKMLDRDQNNELNFYVNSYEYMLNLITSKDKSYTANKLIDAKTKLGNSRFDAVSIYEILKEVNSKEDNERLDVLLNAKDENGNYCYGSFYIAQAIELASKNKK